MKIERTIKAVIISPWASLIVVIIAFAGFLLEMEQEHFQEMLTQVPGMLFVFAMFVFCFVGKSYLLVLFAGLPIHLLFSRLKITHWLAYLSSGVVIGLLFQYIQLLGTNMPRQLQQTGYASYAICSLLVSLSFWHVAVNSHNKSFKPTALRASA